MRGTLTFERLSCPNDQKFVRTVLNDVVYRKPSLSLTLSPSPNLSLSP